MCKSALRCATERALHTAKLQCMFWIKTIHMCKSILDECAISRTFNCIAVLALCAKVWNHERVAALSWKWRNNAESDQHNRDRWLVDHSNIRCYFHNLFSCGDSVLLFFWNDNSRKCWEFANIKGDCYSEYVVARKILITPQIADCFE